MRQLINVFTCLFRQLKRMQLDLMKLFKILYYILPISLDNHKWRDVVYDELPTASDMNPELFFKKLYYFTLLPIFGIPTV